MPWPFETKHLNQHIGLKWVRNEVMEEGEKQQQGEEGKRRRDELSTTKQGHSERHSEEKDFTQRDKRPHPPCFLSLHEMGGGVGLPLIYWAASLLGGEDVDGQAYHLCSHVLCRTGQAFWTSSERRLNAFFLLTFSVRWGARWEVLLL